MVAPNRSRSRAFRASFVRPVAWLVALAVLLSLSPPAEASHKAPYIIRDSDGDLWLDWTETLLGTSRYNADSDPADVDGTCATGAVPSEPPAQPPNATRDDDGDGVPDAAQLCPPPVNPEDLPFWNATEPARNATEDPPLPGDDDTSDVPIPSPPQPNLGTPCDIEGWPGCEEQRDHPDGSNDGARDDYHDQNETPQADEQEEPAQDPDEVERAVERANDTAEPAHNATGPVVREVRATMNETTGLVDVAWVVGEDDEQSDADRYAIYRDDREQPVAETENAGQSAHQTQDRSHPEGNVTYRVVPVYETANGTVQGNGTSSPPQEFQPFPDDVGDEIRKCGPDATDTDLDAICDAAEGVLGTNPFALDSDGDGIPDPLALRLGLVGPNDDSPDDGSGNTHSDLTRQDAAPAETPTFVHGVLGLGATLMAGALGTIVRFRRS